MRFLIDANLPRSTVALVSSLGHAVEFARDVGLGAAPDADIAARARLTEAALLTRDLDFADIRRYPPKDDAGIVVLRMPDDATAKEIVSIVERFLRQPEFLGALRGRLAIVEPDRVRFRPALM
jgi:predicted nuclease of predicted toxin-antitoxin system